MNAHEILAIVLLSWNVITLFIMGIDKHRAAKEKSRVSESTLLLLAFAMGGLGILLGMLLFHHKTRRPLFIVLVPVTLIINVLTLIGILKMISTL
ncbi:MAG: DUF1294 domain-containing protein [Anaerovoracaceae bacterium]|jgi:uncharacterized membrane protein YsdA (DUF1294 family)